MQVNKQTSLLGGIFQQLRELERIPRHIQGVGQVSPSEFHLIEQIGLEGKVTSKELSQQLNITKGGISQLLSKLSKQAWIEREANPEDKRASYLSLTALGEQVFREHQLIHQQFNEALSQNLSELEIDAFNKGLGILNQVLAHQLKVEGDGHEE